MPDVFTYNALIRCEKVNLELFETMTQQGLVPDVITYGCVITALSNSKQPGQALEIFAAEALEEAHAL